ncbi:MAG: aldehyde dehydrogenase family protein, partial [Kordiimonadaceae bacterium]|nr:aldehyde dehydrogenase family protein [Kordiimonadaceae bacterium]
MRLHNGALFRDKAYIDGQWIGSATTFDVCNPADGEPIASVADLGVAETKTAIEAAEKAQIGWRALVAKDRAVILRRWYNLIMDAQEDLATLLTIEMGKPLAEARGEVAYGASFIEWFAEEG